MSIVINSSIIPNTSSLLFTVVSGASLYSAFEWHLSGLTGDSIVGTESSYILVSPASGDKIYVNVSTCSAYWFDGQFYGGTFTGNFSGGSFHYGYLNGTQYMKLATKPKPFII